MFVDEKTQYLKGANSHNTSKNLLNKSNKAKEGFHLPEIYLKVERSWDTQDILKVKLNPDL